MIFKNLPSYFYWYYCFMHLTCMYDAHMFTIFSYYLVLSYFSGHCFRAILLLLEVYNLEVPLGGLSIHHNLWGLMSFTNYWNVPIHYHLKYCLTTIFVTWSFNRFWFILFGVFYKLSFCCYTFSSVNI